MNKKLYKLSILILFVTFISILPIFLSFSYSRMVLDDFVYAAKTHIIWKETHSVFKMLMASFEQVKDVYLNWNGSIIAGFFCAFHGGSFAEKYYFINLFIHFSVFIFSIWKMSEALFVSILKTERSSAIIAFSCILFVSVQFVPDSTDAFFAYNLATMYTGYYSVLFITIAYVLQLTFEEKKSLPKVIMGCLSALIFTGGHLSIGVMGLTFFLCYWLITSVFKIKKNKSIIAITAISIVGFLINATAPGYRNRASEIDYGLSPLSSIFYAIVHGFETINSFTTIYTICLFAIILFLVIRSFAYKPRGNSSCMYPELFACSLFAVYCSLFAANYYALGFAGYTRLEDVGYFSYIWFMVFMIVVIIWLVDSNNHERLVQSYSTTVTWLNKNRIKTCIICAVCAVASILSTGKLDAILGINLSRRLLNGDLKQYSFERDRWIEMCESNPGKDIIVDDLSIYIDAIDKWHIGIEKDEYSWVNGNIAKYYQVKSFTVK